MEDITNQSQQSVLPTQDIILESFSTYLTREPLVDWDWHMREELSHVHREDREGTHDRNLPSGVSNGVPSTIINTGTSSTTAFQFMHLVVSCVLVTVRKREG